MNVTLDMETKAFNSWTVAMVSDMEGRAARQVLRALAFEFLDRVIAKTPVDLGRARGGWASYLIAKGRGAIRTAQKGQQRQRDVKGKFLKGAFEADTFEEGVAEGSFEENFSGAEQFILLINAVKYIVLLEFGSSDQAPAGMMRITFQEMRVHRSGQKHLRDEFVKAVARTNRARRSSAPKWEKVLA